MVETDEKSVENGQSEEVAVSAENGVSPPAVEEEEDESKDGEEEKNGDATGKFFLLFCSSIVGTKN